MFPIAVLIGAPAFGKPCKPARFAKQLAALPALVVVPAGMSADTAFVRALGCDPPPPPTFEGGQPANAKDLIGHPVFAGNGKKIGTIKNLALERKTTSFISLLDTTVSGTTVLIAIPTQSLTPSSKGLMVAESSLKQIASKWRAKPSNQYIYMTWWSRVPWNWSLAPFLGREEIRITSHPAGGGVFVGPTRYGKTQLEGLLRIRDEKRLVIRLAHYKPCRFADGTYLSTSTTGLGYATFNCALKPKH